MPPAGALALSFSPVWSNTPSVRPVLVPGDPSSSFEKPPRLRHFQTTLSLAGCRLSRRTIVDLSDTAGAHASPLGGTQAPEPASQTRHGSHVSARPGWHVPA